jgi:hypothetical protein
MSPFPENTIMIHSVSLWSLRPRLTMSTMMVLVAVAAPCFALYGFSWQFAPVRKSASLSFALVVVGAWSLAAALPALWVGAVQRIPPKGLLVRFAVGNGFLSIVIASLISADTPLLVALLIGAVVLLPSVAWYSMSLMEPGPDRDRMKRACIVCLSYVSQLVLTLVLFVAATSVLHRLS